MKAKMSKKTLYAIPVVIAALTLLTFSLQVNTLFTREISRPIQQVV